MIADDGSSEPTVRGLREIVSSYAFRIVHAWHPKSGFRLAAARDIHVGAFRSEALGSGQSNAARAAGNECDLVCELAVHGVSPWVDRWRMKRFLPLIHCARGAATGG